MNQEIDVGLVLELDEFGCYSGASLGSEPIPNRAPRNVEFRLNGPRKEFKTVTGIKFLTEAEVRAHAFLNSTDLGQHMKQPSPRLTTRRPK